MRIVAGEFRGRTLASPKSSHIRPTSDRTRESLFNILAHSHPGLIDGARVLDLFSGTGALGIEALSRGARFCLFVEQSAEGRGLLRENIDALGLEGRTRIFRRDATDLGPAGNLGSFDLVFADPPYGKGLGERALECAAREGWLAPGAILVLEENATAQPAFAPGIDVIDTRHFGDTVIRILRTSPA